MSKLVDNLEVENLRVLFDDARGMDFADAMLSGEVIAAVGEVEAATDPIGELNATEILMALLKRLMRPKRNVILQNRDRSTPAMIAQMNAIASMPDYYRVAPTKEFASGAPIVFGNDDALPSKTALGRDDKAVAADGRRFVVQYAVVEAADLLTSNSADGIADADYTNGVPGKLRAIAGNGRLAGLKAGYQRGTAADYRRELTEDDMTGIAPAAIESFDAPILVRIMRAEDVTENIGDISNQRGTSDLSPVEQAQNDATRLNLADLDISDDGKPTEAAALAFIAAMPESERNNLMDGKHPGAKAYDRLMAAVFWKAYGDGELVRLYAQSVDSEIKTILGGMASAAGELARLDGAGALDIRSVVTEAASLAVNAKRQGVKLADFAKQTDMTLSPDVMEVVRMFVENIRSAKKIGERLRDAARFAYEEFTKEDSDMFGTVEKATRAQVLDRLANQVDTNVPLFDSVDPMRAIELSGELMQKADALQNVGDNDPIEALTLSDEIMAIIRELENAPAVHLDPAPTGDRTEEGFAAFSAALQTLDGWSMPKRWDKSGDNWQYTTLTLNGGTARIGISTGGVVSVDGHPFAPDGTMNTTVEAVRASVLAALPAPAPIDGGKPTGDDTPVVPDPVEPTTTPSSTMQSNIAIAADNPQRTTDLTYFAEVAAGKVDMWDENLAGKLEAMIAKYPDDSEVTQAWTEAVNAYTNFMVNAMKAA